MTARPDDAKRRGRCIFGPVFWVWVTVGAVVSALASNVWVSVGALCVTLAGVGVIVTPTAARGRKSSDLEGK